MSIEFDRLVSYSDAKQDFKKVAKLADDKGTVVILKDNAPRYVLMDYDEYRKITNAYGSSAKADAGSAAGTGAETSAGRAGGAAKDAGKTAGAAAGKASGAAADEGAAAKSSVYGAFTSGAFTGGVSSGDASSGDRADVGGNGDDKDYDSGKYYDRNDSKRKNNKDDNLNDAVNRVLNEGARAIEELVDEFTKAFDIFD